MSTALAHGLDHAGSDVRVLTRQAFLLSHHGRTAEAIEYSCTMVPPLRSYSHTLVNATSCCGTLWVSGRNPCSASLLVQAEGVSLLAQAETSAPVQQAGGMLPTQEVSAPSASVAATESKVVEKGSGQPESEPVSEPSGTDQGEYARDFSCGAVNARF